MATTADVKILSIKDLKNEQLEVTGQIAGLYPPDSYETKYSQDELEWVVTKDAVLDENQQEIQPAEGRWIPKESAVGERVLKNGAELNTLTFQFQVPPSYSDYTEEQHGDLLEWAKTRLLVTVIPSEELPTATTTPVDLNISG
jgi:hypothetical protein